MNLFGLLAASSFLAISAGTPVLAQTGSDSAPATAAGSSGPASLGDIIVTAQRREARSKDVPIAVTVLSAENLSRSGVVSSQDLVTSVPGMRMNQSGSITNPTIRGVTSAIQFLSEPNVATYVDNVYQASNFVGFVDLPDVESIQVLKGPQGTLFGRNATGGAILVKTRDPEFSPKATIALSYGRYNDVKAQAFVTMPLVSDVLAFSVAGFVEDRDPYMHNIAPNGKERGLSNKLVRAKLRFKPSSAVDFILSGLYAHKINGDSGYGNLNGNNPVRGLVPDALLAPGRNQFASDMILYYETITKSVSLGGTIEAGPGVITTTTSYTATSSPNEFDADNSSLPAAPVFNNGHTKTATQELLYTFKGIPRFNGTIGGFYFWNRMYYDPLFYGPFASIRTNDRNKSFGVFGELSYDLTDRLQLTGGLRYSWERRQANVGFAGPNIPVPDSAMFRLGQKSWSSFTPRASILYRLSDATNLFATYSQGFKSGAFNTYSAQPTPVDPEKLKTIEAGIKSAHRGFDMSLSGFYYDYKNIQVASFDGVNSLLQNAASARIYGADFTVNWKPLENLSINAGASYLNAKYKAFPGASVYVPNPLGALPAGASLCNFRSYTPAYNGNVGISCDVSGNQMPLAPKFSASLGMTYSKETDAGLFTLSANGYYSSRFYFEPLNRVPQNAYAVLGGKISWSPRATPELELSLYGQNLTNTRVYETVLIQSADTFRFQIPTTYGAQIRYSF